MQRIAASGMMDLRREESYMRTASPLIKWTGVGILMFWDGRLFQLYVSTILLGDITPTVVMQDPVEKEGHLQCWSSKQL